MEEQRADQERKKAAIIAFTRNGSQLALRLAGNLLNEWEVEITLLQRFCMEAGKIAKKCSVRILEESLSDWTKEQFLKADAILFVGAAGIAVRAIAPYVKDKLKDPAVIVLDEKGCYCIPLLSGHVGGANELARLLAVSIGAIPVITTASDLQERFAADVFAVKNNMVIRNRDGIKQITGELLEGKRVGMITDSCNLPKEVPKGIVLGEKCEKNIVITIKKQSFWEEEAAMGRALILIPRCVTLGMGCRKGVGKELLKRQAEEAFQKYAVYMEAVSYLASVDRKKEEFGLIELAEECGWEFVTYSSNELEEVGGDFSESVFVKNTLGVGNVCERAAVLHSGGELCIPKYAGNGVTAAAAYKKKKVIFE